MQQFWETGRIACFASLILFIVLSANQLQASEADVLSWQTLSPIPDAVGVAGPFAGISHGKLVVAGGANFPDGPPWEGHKKVWHDTIFLLDLTQGQKAVWSTSEDQLPEPSAYGVSLTIEEGALFIGGGDATQHTTKVRLATVDGNRVRFTDLPPLPMSMAFGCGALLDRTVYIAGGRKTPDAKRPLHTFWKLDLGPSSNLKNRVSDEEQAASLFKTKWEELEPWPGRPRMLAVAGAQDDSFFLFGGVDLEPDEEGDGVHRVPLVDAYRYSPREGWKQVADLPHPVTAAPSPALPLGNVDLAIVGGDSGTVPKDVPQTEHPGFSREVLVYNPLTDAWAEMGTLPEEWKHQSLAAPVTTATVPYRGNFLIPSGEMRPGIRTAQVLVAKPLPHQAQFGTLDYIVVVIYLGCLVGMGVYFSRREQSTNDFFLGGRRIPWWAAGLSIFGTMLSAITFMAIPAKAFAENWIYIYGFFAILFVTPLIIRCYLPFFRRLEVTTAYEYLEKRFNVGARLIGSAAFIFVQLGRMGIVLFLPALALAAVTGINVIFCIVIMGILATFYTVLGGIEAVIWTDVLQVIVLLGGAIISLVTIIMGVDGGLPWILTEGYAAGKFTVFDLTLDFTTASIWVVCIGRIFETLIPYTADQTVVQRYLTTSNEKEAARSIWTNSLMVIPSGMLFFFLGTALWAFYRQHPAMLVPLDQTDRILPWFIAQQLPVGLAGLIIAALFAAAMSSLDSSMNSIATAITTDWYRRFRPSITDKHCLRFARILTLLLGIVGTLCAIYLAILEDASLWDRYLKVLNLFGAGLAGLFLVGIFTRRVSGAGAVIGFFASAAVLYFVNRYTHAHFFLYPLIGIGTCSLTACLLSLILPERRNLQGLTIYTISEENTTE